MGIRLSNQKSMLRLRRRVEKQFYNDTAYYYPPASPTDDLDGYGQPATPQTSGNVGPIACSFTDATAEARKWLEGLDIHHVDLLMRFEKAGWIPLKGGRIIAAGRFNEFGNYEDETYEIVNIRDRDVFGYVLGLRRAVA